MFCPMPEVTHLIEERAISLLDSSPLGLPSSCDLDHRLDVHPGQLTPLYHLDSDLKAGRKNRLMDRKGDHLQAPRLRNPMDRSLTTFGRTTKKF